MNLRLFGTLAATVLLLSRPAMADEREQVLEAMGKCASVADDKSRLACYDALAPRAKDALATPPASVASSGPPTKEEQKSWFGFNLGNIFGTSPAQQTTPQQFGSDKLPQPETKPVPGAPQEVDSITAGVTDYAFTPFGKFIVFLDNGQVWRQSEGDADQAHFKKNPKDNTVTISRGFIGSYNLKINDSDMTFKVTRVK